MSYSQPPPGGQPPGGQPPGGQPPGGQPPGGQSPGGQPSRYPPPPANQPSSASSAGFFGALFDFSFSNFVTPKIVKFVYILATIGLAIAWVVFVISGFLSDEPAVGLFFLVIGAIVFIIYLAFIRMTLEFYFAIVRMSEDINRRLPGA